MEYCCSIEDVTSAMERIRPYVHETPLMTSSTLDKLTGHRIFLKTENFQKTGSFKLRGATNAVVKIMKNTPEVKCVVTDSSGNHGQALACAARDAGIHCYVVMTNNSPKCKIESVKGYGAEVVLCEPSERARKEGSKRIVCEKGAAYVSSSQSCDVIAGQGTIAMEILKQNPDIDVIIASVGGGGMVAGIATAAKALNPNIKVIAAEPQLANDCYISKKIGVLTPNPTFPNTIADGVRISLGALTWPIVRDLVDDVITVTEAEIKFATLLVWERCKLVIETSAGVAVAAVFTEKFRNKLFEYFGDDSPRNIAVVLCGGNFDFSTFHNLLI